MQQLVDAVVYLHDNGKSPVYLNKSVWAGGGGGGVCKNKKIGGKNIEISEVSG